MGLCSKRNWLRIESPVVNRTVSNHGIGIRSSADIGSTNDDHREGDQNGVASSSNHGNVLNEVLSLRDHQELMHQSTFKCSSKIK